MILFKKYFFKFCFIVFLSLSLDLIGFLLFGAVLMSTNININYTNPKFNLYFNNPNLWIMLKKCFIISYTVSSLIISNFILTIFINSFNLSKNNLNKGITNTNSLNILIGYDSLTNTPIYLPEKGLFQNILITGTIGTGKTSSAMYPFTKQLINYKSNDSLAKIGMLILDVKGNYYNKVLEFAKMSNRLNDVIVIELNGKYSYNPLDKPNLKASVLANQLKSILLLFSPNNTESYWIDKAEEVLCESIKLCRLYNNNYVTFTEIHNIITKPRYYLNKINSLRYNFQNNNFSTSQVYDLISCLHFFNSEFFSLDERTLNILKSEITRITNCFISDYDIINTFCPNKSTLNFNGFQDVIKSGKIVVLNMNINKYRNLSKIIAAYLKMDFQTEVMSSISNNNLPKRITSFISDEYSEYVTSLDANFFSQSREAKCINIISTQSYTSLLNTLNNQYTVKVIVQNLVNKLWFRSDDIFTIEDAQKQIGKIEKQRISKTLSENAKKTFYNNFTNTFTSKDSNISESINKYSQLDFKYDTNFFTQHLETFYALSFLSDGTKIISPSKLKMLPYFQNKF